MEKRSVIIKGWASIVLCMILVSSRRLEQEASPGSTNRDPDRTLNA